MTDFLSKITAPVAGENPFGADVNHYTVYERLKGEMGKLGDIDVNAVETMSLDILTEKSKDLRAMAFLAYSMLRKGDIERLADVFCAIASYCGDSFESIYPQRESAKLAALRWFSDQRFSSQCPKVDVSSADDKPHVIRLKEALEKLKLALDKRFASTGAPFPNSLYKRVTEWERAIDRQPTGNSDDGKNIPAPANIGGGGNNNGNSGANNNAGKIIIELTDGEYREIVGAVKKIETLLKERR